MARVVVWRDQDRTLYCIVAEGREDILQTFLVRDEAEAWCAKYNYYLQHMGEGAR